jgi:hypothetical protein
MAAPTAIDRIKAAIAGIDVEAWPMAHAQVDPADVVALAAQAQQMPLEDFIAAESATRGIDPAKLTAMGRQDLVDAHAKDGRTQIVRDLEMGAKPHTAPRKRPVMQKVVDLQHLLGQLATPAPPHS